MARVNIPLMIIIYWKAISFMGLINLIFNTSHNIGFKELPCFLHFLSIRLASPTRPFNDSTAWIGAKQRFRDRMFRVAGQIANLLCSLNTKIGTSDFSFMRICFEIRKFLTVAGAIFLCIPFLLFSQFLYGQETNSQVSGIVRSENGEVLPGATVTAVHELTKNTYLTETNARG